jgi:hypothetical protein
MKKFPEEALRLLQSWGLTTDLHQIVGALAWLSSHFCRFPCKWSREFWRPEFLSAFSLCISIACNRPGGPFWVGGGGGVGGDATFTETVVLFVMPLLSVTVRFTV